MKTTKQTRLFTAWIALLLVFSFLTFPVTALDLTTTDYESNYEESPEPAISNNATVRPNNEQTANTSAIVTASTLADGVYAFRNIGNGSFWIDTQYNSTVPGHHLQQYIFNGSTPIDSFSRSCLFKITKVAGSGVGARYVVRSMLNNLMSFGFSGNDVMTKTIPANDADVAIEDTFYISYTASGYMIRPYGQSYIVAANDTDAYGASGAPDSYLINTAVGAAGSQGKWEIHQYTGSAQHGYAISGLDTGLTSGKRHIALINTWSTVIGANSAAITVSSTYADFITVTETPLTYRSPFQIDADKIGYSQLTIHIKNAYGSSVASYLKSYIIGPDIPLGEPMYMMNRTTRKYASIENASTANGANLEIQAWSRNNASKWIFERGNQGYYRIRSSHSGKYIGLNSADGTTICQYSTLNDYTYWFFEKTGSQAYKLICKADTTQVLCTPSYMSPVGTNLQYAPFVNDPYQNDLWLLISAYYSIANYYDISIPFNSSFLNRFEISNTNLATVFKDYFDIDFTRSNTSFWNECPTSECELQNTRCMNNCNEDYRYHHKNVDYIFAHMYDGSQSAPPRINNQIRILWMNRPTRCYCLEDNNNTHQSALGILGIVELGEPNIQILSLDELYEDIVLPSDLPSELQYIIPMTIVSIHEMVHCFNLDDVYSLSYHIPYNNSCLMGYYDNEMYLQMYQNYFLTDPENRCDLFCDSCCSTILSKYLADPFFINEYNGY